MKNPTFLLVLAVIALSACSGQEAASPTATVRDATATPAEVPQVAQAKPAPTSPERIKEIEASGQTGLWSSVTEVCNSEAKNGLRTTLTWNVKDSGATRVTVYVIDTNGREQHFGQGGPVDEKETGPWATPGVSFKIKDYNTSKELGSVVIGEKSC